MQTRPTHRGTLTADQHVRSIRERARVAVGITYGQHRDAARPRRLPGAPVAHRLARRDLAHLGHPHQPAHRRPQLEITAAGRACRDAGLAAGPVAVGGDAHPRQIAVGIGPQQGGRAAGHVAQQSAASGGVQAAEPGLEAVALGAGEGVVGGVLDIGEVAGDAGQLQPRRRRQLVQGGGQLGLHQTLAVHSGLDLEVDPRPRRPRPPPPQRRQRAHREVATQLRRPGPPRRGSRAPSPAPAPRLRRRGDVRPRRRCAPPASRPRQPGTPGRR